MIEAEFHSLCAYLEASDKEVGVSTDMWLSLPPSPRSRSRAKIHQISLEAAEILSVLFFF